MLHAKMCSCLQLINKKKGGCDIAGFRRCKRAKYFSNTGGERAKKILENSSNERTNG